jgi:MEMO1 family protein
MIASTPTTRAPAVAGLFYPQGREALERELARLLDEAESGRSMRAPKALIAPHAGYVYSGPVAASAYALLKPVRSSIARVVLLGPTHRVALRGLALPDASSFATPLGSVALDSEAISRVRDMPQVVVSDAAHLLEHSLEVHLPFLQTALEAFRLVPFAVGDAEPAEVAEVLERLWGGPETLIVVSSDLSHYLAYQEARALDRETAAAIVALRSDIDHEQACGATPVCGLTLVARKRRLSPKLVDLRNSGDTSGERSRVVGYGAFAFYEAA